VISLVNFSGRYTYIPHPPSLEFKSLHLDLRINEISWQKLKTSRRRKESVGIPNIHKIAPEDHIKPVDYFQGFYPLNSWPPSNLDFTFASSQSKSKNPSRSPRAKTRDFEMAPRKNKSKVEEGTVANMSTGWRKSKMSESLV